MFRLRAIVLAVLAGSAVLAVVLLLAAKPFAQSPGSDSSPIGGAVSKVVDETLSSLAQRLVVESLPQEFDEKKDWGKTKQVVDGLRLRDDGDGLKLRKHKSEVNDGLWKQYRAAVVDPQHQLQIRIENLKEDGPQRATMSVFIIARLHGEARLEQWKDGVKLYTVTTDADAKIESRLDWEMSWHWAAGTFADFVVEPRVTAADIELVEFDLKKVSKIEGWAAHELGEGFKHTLAKKLREQEPRLVDKINKGIQKKPDRLHFSPAKTAEKSLAELQSLLGFGGK